MDDKLAQIKKLIFNTDIFDQFFVELHSLLLEKDKKNKDLEEVIKDQKRIIDEYDRKGWTLSEGEKKELRDLKKMVNKNRDDLDEAVSGYPMPLNDIGRHFSDVVSRAIMKIDKLSDAMTSWMNRALSAETRVRELEREYSTQYTSTEHVVKKAYELADEVIKQGKR